MTNTSRFFRGIVACLLVMVPVMITIFTETSVAQQTDTAAENSPTVQELVSFRGRNPFESGTIVDNGGDGGRALRLDKGYTALNRKMDWSDYDFLKFDMELLAEKPQSLHINMKDEKTEGYWTRFNYSSIVPPGKSTFIIPLKQLFVGEKSRPGRNLLLDKIVQFTISIGENPSGPLVLSNFRLEKDNTAKQVSFDGLFAFDFGTKTSPVMEGFTQITSEDKYTPELRWGFRNNAWIHGSQDCRQPEPLYQDFIIVRSGDFAIDVPNGKYRIMVNIDSPGGFWGDNQLYTKRTIKANGKVVLEETLDFATFNQNLYRFWNIDDMPWENAFDKYLKTSFLEKTFEADVTGGQLRITFEGDNWGCCVSSLIVFSVEKSEQGEKFIRYTEDQRRFHFDNYFKRTLPTPKGDTLQATTTDKDRGYVLFQRDFMAEVNYNDTPYRNEIVTAQTELHGEAFQGEYEPLTVSLVPLQSLGKVTLTTNDWQGTNGAVIPSSAIDIGYVSYRLSRIAMDGSVYTIAPRLILPFNSVPVQEGITRRFWLTVRTPVDCLPGTYKGKLTIQADNGGTSDIAVHFIVHKGKLDDIDIPVGPVGHAVRTSWNSDAEGKEFSRLLFDKSLRKLREYGFTSLTGIPVIPYRGFKDGKPVLDFQEADQKMKLLKELGFTLVPAYGAGVRGFDAYYQDTAAMRAAGFDDYSEFIRAVYSEVERHAQNNDWIPVYYYLADEPIDGDIIRSTENAEAYQKAFPKGPPYFSGSSSFTGGNVNDPHYRLSKAFHVVDWNTHDETGVRLLHEAGGHWAFYNGGNRWTFGDYLFKCVREFDLKFRASWHFNACAGNPYYALDCREDDYAWCNSSPHGELIPSLEFERLREGVEDYRRLQTLERLAKEKGDASGLKIIENRLQSFRLGQRNHDSLFPVSDWKDFRKIVDEKIDTLQ